MPASAVSALAGSAALVAFVTPDCDECTPLLRRVSALRREAKVIALSEGGDVAGATPGVTSFPALLAIDRLGRLVAALSGLPSTAAIARAARRAEAQ